MRHPSLMIFGAALLITLPSSVLARGGSHTAGMHGFGHGPGGHGFAGHVESSGQFVRNRRSANDGYAKAASGEMDKLLDQKIKSICRGC
jgi:hypothetical protein